MTIHRKTRGFTLVEMLVVIGIIAVLAALLLPAVMSAINRARNAVIAIEVKQLETAIEAYRLEKGDYPPNFRDVETVRRHIAKCYPKINPQYFLAFMRRAFPVDANGNPRNPVPTPNNLNNELMIDEAESLVFWLGMTDTNPQFPFLSYMQPPGVTSPLEINAKRYHDFDETRLIETSPVKPPINNPPVPMSQPLRSFQAKFCKETHYLYLDSRSYDRPIREPWDLGRFPSDSTPVGGTFALCRFDQSAVRPYWSLSKNPNGSVSVQDPRDDFKPVNATTFQLICAGQDGDFGFDPAVDTKPKYFNSGENYTDGDKDNITNFSGGRTLGDSVP